MRSFLRLFSAFRKLESQAPDLDAAREECQRVQGENDRLQDRLDAALEDRKQLWSTVQQCIDGERTAYQASLNMTWQQRGFGAPYPESPQIPPNAAPRPTQDPVIPRREIPSERIARATARFTEEIADRLIPKQ